MTVGTSVGIERIFRPLDLSKLRNRLRVEKAKILTLEKLYYCIYSRKITFPAIRFFGITIKFLA